MLVVICHVLFRGRSTQPDVSGVDGVPQSCRHLVIIDLRVLVGLVPEQACGESEVFWRERGERRERKRGLA
eukprot:1094852-Prorocentrum_minimum.AAC.2